ncbi:acetylornithine aminotransferase [Heyndrickxia shackletonii]|uniref:Acetylornithine aminotransferase n=1 Tax=Heyndrickxia shackletonii TaxID=157838 RepID=A0A0Q3WYD6_9BACI|nr:acetylornithine transaminase [Heyndrickxia shackletonii]KQL54455.1 acetylornithine aminotransferase [Heyndrickxia shackletonii]MBB2479683.1 acetylornithine transaminase [Bacillus sp. APMAM]NEY99180.1 acetylornithine transaminase [Heyndrickxia shackletonii]RTZ56902.1 acetylornithine transaminase [Bacillus sp. SAJ1]
MLKTSSLMNTYKRAPLSIAKGKGSFVWDENGNQYLDFTSGIATCNLGHVPEAVKNALVNQLDQLWHCSNLYQIKIQEDLAQILTENSCFDVAFFCNSGAEANEAAIKLARLYASQIKQINNPEIVTFKQSFHGRTMATLSATGQEKIQKGFEPLLEGFTYLPYNDSSALDYLKNQSPAAVMLELVQGEGGVIPADKEWIEKLVSISKCNDILIIVDEVQTGMGRTGTLFAYEQYNFEPDIITSAKGLGSGFPIGAMLAKEHVAKAFGPGTHGSTFGGNPLASTAGLATVQYILSNEVLGHVQSQSKYFFSELEKLKTVYPQIKEVRGRGLLIGIVLENAGYLVELAREEKLLILTAGENVVRLLPPLTVTNEEMDLFLISFKKILAKMER